MQDPCFHSWNYLHPSHFGWWKYFVHFNPCSHSALSKFMKALFWFLNIHYIFNPSASSFRQLSLQSNCLSCTALLCTPNSCRLLQVTSERLLLDLKKMISTIHACAFTFCLMKFIHKKNCRQVLILLLDQFTYQTIYIILRPNSTQIGVPSGEIDFFWVMCHE